MVILRRAGYPSKEGQREATNIWSLAILESGFLVALIVDLNLKVHGSVIFTTSHSEFLLSQGVTVTGT